MILNNSLDFTSKGNILGLTKDDFHDSINIDKIVRVTGTGSIAANLLQWTGAINIISQYAQIKTITSLVNATDVYATIEDGASSPLTKTPGSVISGFEVGSFFLKDKIAGETYSTLQADQARLSEVSGVKAGSPFIVNAMDAVASYIQFHLTTTDTPVDFTMEVHFEYRRLTRNSLLWFL